MCTGSDEEDSDEFSFDSELSDGGFPPPHSDSNFGGGEGEDEDDELMGGGQEVDELEEGYSSEGGASSSAAGSSIYGGRKTARQRAKEMGGDEALELMSLPNRTFLLSFAAAAATALPS